MTKQLLRRLKRAAKRVLTDPRSIVVFLHQKLTVPKIYSKLRDFVLRRPMVTRFTFWTLYGKGAASDARGFRQRRGVSLVVYTAFALSRVKEVIAGKTRDESLHALLDKEKFSAFSRDIDGRMSCWRSSAPYRDILATEKSRRQARTLAGQPPPRGRASRVLVVSENWNFGDTLMDALQEEGFHVRTFHFEQFRKRRNSGFTTTHLFVPCEYYATPAQVRKTVAEKSPLFSDLMEWADIVLAEWSNLPAIWLSRLLDERKRLVLRLHSYEAFTYFPYFVNWGGVDGIILVSEPVRRVLWAQHGERLGAVASATLPNIKRRPLPGSMVADRAFVLGLAGYNNANKNPILALDILRQLRRRDGRWRLELVGHPWAATGISEDQQLYRDAFLAALHDPEIADAVSILPFTDDVPGWCRSVGFILSTSDREGTHEVLVEGMSVGAVPIIRNWPMMAPFGGPKAVYPRLSHLVFDDAEEAAEMIAQQNAHFAEASQDMLQLFEDELSPEAVIPKYGAFLRRLLAENDAAPALSLTS